MNISNVLDIILKKCITWPLQHCFKGPKHSFLFCSPNLRSLSMKLAHDIFFYSLTFKERKKRVTNISNVLDIILKNCMTWPFKQC